jgi:uroporphyrinogen-III synthase
MPASPAASAHSGERPLAGRRLVLTRPREQAADFEERVRALGGEPEIAPAIAIAPPERFDGVDAALDTIALFDWIVFTSANAVRALTGRAAARGIDRTRLASRRLGAVGPSTAAVVAQELRPADAIARTATARALGSELPVAAGARVLVPHGSLADGALVEVLRARGAVPHPVLAYRTVAGEDVARIVSAIRAGRVDALLFASGSAVRFVAAALHEAETREPAAASARPAIFCIGPSTARAAAAAGLPADGVAEVATQHELIEVAARWFAAHTGRSA